MLHLVLSDAEGRPLATSVANPEAKELPEEIREILLDCLKRVKVRVFVRGPALGRTWEALLYHPRLVWIRGESAPGHLATKKLRVLVAWSNPGSVEYPHLENAEIEAKEVCRALGAPECQSAYVFELPNANQKGLKGKISSWKPHILHFIGHCDLNVLGGFLVMEGLPDSHDRLFGDELAHCFEPGSTRLIVLTGCSSVAVAERLSASGIPAVVSMSRHIRDRSAYYFSRTFYAALTSGSSIDEAFGEGRDALEAHGVDHDVPVLLTSRPQIDRPESVLPPNNITKDLRPFIGRKQTLKRLTARLADPECRVLMIHGPGGMGKTRLARQAGFEGLARYPDGVWEVDCSSLTDEPQLVAAIGGAIGSDPGSDLQGVCAELQNRRNLLIIDCFERLVDSYKVLQTIAAQCPTTQILITSRIQPTDCPAFDLETMAGSERVNLFESAARFVQPDFRINRANRKVCKQIVDLVEGVPLAILLAAGRLRHYPLNELRDRLLVSKLNVLKRFGPETDRHASIRIVVSDSVELLPAELRSLALKLSVFAGSFTLQAACAVLPQERDVEDRLFELCDHALLTAFYSESGTRFRSLDTIREFLGEAAASLDLTEIQLRFVRYYCDLAQEPGLTARTPSEILPDLRNYQRAAQLAFGFADDKAVEVFIVTLARPFAELGLNAEFELMLDWLARQGAPKTQMLMDLIGLKGMLHRRAGRFDEAAAEWWRRANLAKGAGLVEVEADCYMDIADLGLHRGDHEQSRKALALGNELLNRISLGLQSHFAILRAKLNVIDGDFDRAWAEVAFVEVSLASLNDGDRMFAANALSDVKRSLGDFAGAVVAIQEMLRIAISTAKAHSVARGILTLAELRNDEGDRELAVSLCVFLLTGQFHSKPMIERCRDLLTKFGAPIPKPGKGLAIEAWLRACREDPRIWVET